MRKIIIFVLVCFSSALFSQEKQTTAYNGIWRSGEYGETIEIKNNSVIIFQETEGKLLKRQFSQGHLEENELHINSTVPFGGNTQYTVLLSNNILTLVESHSGNKYHYYRLEKRPPIIDYSDDPIYNLEYFWNMQNERYPYFKERNIDWESAKREIMTYKKQETSADSLWEHLKKIVDYFDTDGHIWIADKNGEVFYSPSNSGAKESIRPKKELLFLIGEKYLDNHEYQTLGNGKILYKYLGDSIGYINIMSFYQMSEAESKDVQLENLSEDLNRLYEYFSAAKGLIVDVRYNGGGNDWNALLLAGLFTTKNIPVYSKRPRIQSTDEYGQPETYHVYALKNNFTQINKVLLSSRYSASATESFLIAAQKFPNSVTIGEPSKGLLSDSYVFELPNGAFFGTYSDKVFSYDGKIYENIGVPVDIEVQMQDTDFEKGKDTVLDYALDILKKKKALNKE